MGTERARTGAQQDADQAAQRGQELFDDGVRLVGGRLVQAVQDEDREPAPALRPFPLHLGDQRRRRLREGEGQPFGEGLRQLAHGVAAQVQ